ncbi:hypothetical protein LPJ61_002811 [Coemansia biformis]|uniref:RNase H type-1 domain-containing protein n=1 Tax=Coemansia biformis TaxID=1286918 RepID=A0A9W7YE29_9FUNG|nr:hypothetical protein LPJ61_002811 [Coemansia biformis]
MPGHEHCWWAHMADILARWGVSIMAPTMAGDLQPTILMALCLGWTAGRTPMPPERMQGGQAAWSQRYNQVGKVILDLDNSHAYVQMARSGILHIDQVFHMVDGVLELCPGLGRAFWTFAWRQLGMRAAAATKVVVYTDGSLTPAMWEWVATMGFAAVFCFEPDIGPVNKVVISGTTRDRPFLSMTAELMAILAVAVLLPPDQAAVIRSDSQVAITLVQQLQD